MRRLFVSFALILALLVSMVAAAEGIDFAAMSDDELAQLIADAQSEQRSRRAAADGETIYALPCTLLDVDGYKLEVTDVSVFEYENNLFITMSVIAENQSEYDIEIDMSLSSYGDYDVRNSYPSESIRVTSGKKANGEFTFLLFGITDTTIKDFDFEVSVWDKGRSLYNLYRTETLHGLLP